MLAKLPHGLPTLWTSVDEIALPEAVEFVQVVVKAERPDAVTVLPVAPKPEDERAVRPSVSVTVNTPLPESVKTALLPLESSTQSGRLDWKLTPGNAWIWRFEK